MTGVRRSIFTVLTLLLCLNISSLEAQTNISGIINAYTQVTALDLANNRMTVSSTAGFSQGDLLLILQMQGAAINTANSTAFGTVTNFNGAGNHELAILCEIDNGDFVFENTLLNTYATTGNIQIIRVPTYTNATVTGTLTGQAWNGTTGGVLALSVTNTLLLNADINMDGLGFRGGTYQNSSFNCNFTSSNSDYRYNTANFGGRKGEGIANYISGMEYGRGAQANGGGGGNDHNSGGAGGANGGPGGFGGINAEPSFFGCKGNFPGHQGKTPTLTSARIFLGGGGGSGHGNNNQGTSGANGGGIIFIIANTLQTGSSNMISANGLNAAQSLSDGAGGGGAGGSIHLQVNSFTGIPAISVQGGNGGNADNENLTRCFGPGGGGAGGVVKSSPALPGTILPVLTGGNAGVVLRSPCSGSQGATAGGAGSTAVTSIPAGTVSDPACGLLPVTWLDIEVTATDRRHLVTWVLGQEFNNEFFTVERSTDGIEFESLAKIPSRGNSILPTTYSWEDPYPAAGISYYRVKQTNLDGLISYSGVVNIRSHMEMGIHIFPNPIAKDQHLHLEISSPKEGEVFIEVFQLTGKQVYRKLHALPAGLYAIDLEGHTFAPGTYLVRVFNETFSQQMKVVFQ